MISRKTLKIAGAAILGTFVGTGSAHAVVYMDGDDLTGQVTYALEGFATEYDGDEVSGYYTIPDPGTNRFDVKFDLDLDAASGQAIRLDFTLENMVFGGAAALTSTDLTVQAAGVRGTNVSGPAVTAVLQSGGAKGDTSAVYTITRTAILSNEMYVTLAIKDVAIGLDATGGTGTVTMTSTKLVLNTPVTSDAQSLAMVKVEPVYMGTATPASPEASLGDDGNYRTFAAGSMVASIGSLELGVKDGSHYLRAAGTAWDTAVALADGSRTQANIVRSGTVELGGGRLDFLQNVFLSSAATCNDNLASFVEDTDDGEGVSLAWLTGDDRVSIDTFHSSSDKSPMRHVCVQVDGMTDILAVADNFTATIDLVPLTGAVFPPTASEVVDLGRIGRGGTDVTIPYLTTFGSYNQRIVMTNRGTRAVDYSMSFTTEEGVTASAGDGATGTLPANSVTVVRARDAVTISGGTRAAASINLQAPSSVVEVATVQVNTSNGSTDTVVYSE